MTTYGDPFSTSLPPVGASGPQYATDVNSILTDIMSRLASKVPLSSLQVTTDLSLASFNLTNTSTVGLVNLSGINSGGSSVPRIEAVLGDFYFIGPSGAVKITAGTNLNAAGLGGITGDYGGVNPAQFRYDSANTRYDAFANQTTGLWAYVRALGLDIAGGSTSTARARLLWGGSSNTTYTLPAAPPATQTMLQMDNTGAFIESNVLASGANLTLQGTGHILRGTRTCTIPFTAFTFVPMANGSILQNTSFGVPGGHMGISTSVALPIQPPDADTHLSTITSVIIDHQPTGSGTITFGLLTQTGVTFTAIPGALTTSLSTPVTLTPTVPFNMPAGTTLWLQVTTSGTNQTYLFDAQVTSTIVT